MQRLLAKVKELGVMFAIILVFAFAQLATESVIVSLTLKRSVVSVLWMVCGSFIWQMFFCRGLIRSIKRQHIRELKEIKNDGGDQQDRVHAESHRWN